MPFGLKSGFAGFLLSTRVIKPPKATQLAFAGGSFFGRVGVDEFHNLVLT